MSPVEFWTAFSAVATLLAALGTIAAFALAFFQIYRERSARIAGESRARAAERIAQARRISGWIGGTLPESSAWATAESGRSTAATLLNGSEEPIYRIVVWLAFIQGDGPSNGEAYRERALSSGPGQPATLATLPPGAYVVALPGGWGGMMRKPGVEVAFDDAAGVHWVRRAGGDLHELPRDPLEYYEIDLPVEWEDPVRAS